MIVIVSVADVDDTAPEFIGVENWNFRVNEIDPGAQFTPGEIELTQRILVSDKDAGSDKKFTFSLM